MLHIFLLLLQKRGVGGRSRGGEVEEESVCNIRQKCRELYNNRTIVSVYRTCAPPVGLATTGLMAPVLSLILLPELGYLFKIVSGIENTSLLLAEHLNLKCPSANGSSASPRRLNSIEKDIYHCNSVNGREERLADDYLNEGIEKCCLEYLYSKESSTDLVFFRSNVPSLSPT